MNITFIVGNGFDINLGARTSYNDFYKSLTPRQIIANEIYRDIIRFKIPESIINHELINKYTEIKISNDKSKDEWRTFISENEIDNFNEFKDTIELLKKYNYTLVSNYDQWSDLEEGLGKYLEKVTLENLENFFKDCDKLRLDLEHYLYEEEKNLIHSYDNDRNINELKNSLIKFYDFLTEKDKKNIIEIISKYREAVTYNFISLNYTNFLDKFIDLARENETLRKININSLNYANVFSPIIHIHGKLDEGMIIGVDNKKQIFNKDIRDDERITYLIKPLCNEELRNEKNILCKNMINKSHIICLFGVSLGETDRQWWEVIDNWLIDPNYENRRLIIFGYKPSLKSGNLRETLEFQRYLRKNMKKYLQESKKKDQSIQKQLDNKIMIALNTEMFKLNYINVEDNEIAVTN